MYIPEFFRGILFTVLAEIVTCIVAVLMIRRRDKGETRRKEGGEEE